MKLLNRLREVWATQIPIGTDNEDTQQIGIADAGFDEYAFQQETDGSPFYSIPGMSTVDGLRQRISGVHEDFPPGLMEQGEYDGGY